VLRSLPELRYSSAFEPGCSIGVLTAALATRCDALLASDIAPTAVRLARERCARLRNVRIEQADMSQSLPDGPFDLIVLSELGYYFTRAELTRITRELAARMAPGGDFVAVHWLGESSDHLLHGGASIRCSRALHTPMPCRARSRKDSHPRSLAHADHARLSRLMPNGGPRASPQARQCSVPGACCCHLPSR